MKAILIIASSLLLASNAMADTCPPAKNLNINQPPPGWAYVPSPTLPGYQYLFSKALHYFTFNENLKKIVCIYTAEGAPGPLVPSMQFISTKTYEQPYFSQHPQAPWQWAAGQAYSVYCQPGDNNPAVCIFQ